jgi:asparagine synthase (glutamine-hydrolysing)
MCGICGFVGVGGPTDLASMSSALSHRGPDASGEWTDPTRRVFLGHRRLSIVDLATGAQPMSTIDGELVVVFNGEIYNHAELRAELEGLGHHFFTDHSDTEVLLHGYREWGVDLPKRLNGMWAFALYDVYGQTVFLSRDRFGKKPLFYSTVHGGFAFASEAESLRRHSAIRPRLSVSPQAVKKYFGYGYIPAPLCIWASVHKLPAGNSLVVSVNAPTAPRVRRYWQFELEPEPIEGPRAAVQVAERLRHELDRAVLRRLVADVSIGVFLSGGIDSSAIAALACQNLPHGRVNTFALGFEEPSFDETRFARIVARHCKTAHHEERLSIEQGRELLPKLVAALDEPIGDSSLLPTALLARFAREEIKVALGGDGGDELFAGYDPFSALRAADWYSRYMPRPLHRGIAMLIARLPVSHRNMSFDFKTKRFLRGIEKPKSLWLPTWMAPLTAEELSEMLQEPIAAEDLYEEAISAWDRCSQKNQVDRTLQFYTELYLQDDILVKVDRASMQVGLEVRAPMLDINVVEIARKIPWQWKFRKGQTKYILKKAMEPLLPPSILYRKKKGFGMPIGSWFKNGTLTIDNPAIAPEYVRRRLRAHREGRLDDRAFLWNVWLLTEWQRAHST